MKNLKLRCWISSWGSYNECNDRALGTPIDFENYEDIDEIIEELKKRNFELDGIDEELFCPDYDCDINLELDNYSSLQEYWDRYEQINEAIEKLGLEQCQAVIECLGLRDLLDNYSSMEVYLYKNMSGEAAMEEWVWGCYGDVKNLFNGGSWLSRYLTIDYEQMFKDSDTFHEYSGGACEIIY